MLGFCSAVVHRTGKVRFLFQTCLWLCLMAGDLRSTKCVQKISATTPWIVMRAETFEGLAHLECA